MTVRRPAIGFLGRFGRSSDLRQFDQALRSLDLHPNLVPEAVKITVVNLVKGVEGNSAASHHYGAAAEIIAYCMTGAETFAAGNGDALLRRVEGRVEAAIDSGDSLDARLILLALHAGVIQPSVVDRFGLVSDQDRSAD